MKENNYVKKRKRKERELVLKSGAVAVMNLP